MHRFLDFFYLKYSNKIVDKHHICEYNKHKTEVKYILIRPNKKAKIILLFKINEISMPFGRKIQLKKDLREAA